MIRGDCTVVLHTSHAKTRHVCTHAHNEYVLQRFKDWILQAQNLLYFQSVVFQTDLSSRVGSFRPIRSSTAFHPILAAMLMSIALRQLNALQKDVRCRIFANYQMTAKYLRCKRLWFCTLLDQHSGSCRSLCDCSIERSAVQRAQNSL